MKQKLQILLSASLFCLLLAACGTAEQQNSEQDNTNNASNHTAEEIAVDKDETAKEDGTQQKANEDNLGNQIQYTSKDETYAVETNMVEEDNYIIHILDGYELTKEEPGKEMLYLKDNDAISMRIEVIPKNDSSFEYLVKNTEDMMTAINSDYQPFDISGALKEYPEIANSAAYMTTVENDEIIGIVYEKNNILVRLTVFDQKDYDLKDALIKMGLTIEEK